MAYVCRWEVNSSCVSGGGEGSVECPEAVGQQAGSAGTGTKAS